MTLWVVLVLLSLAALGFVVWPLYRDSGRLGSLLAVVIVLIVTVSAALYHHTGHPNVPSGAGTMPDADEMVASLEERLQESPDDVNGWIMLGRSYQTMQRYDAAISAFEKAIALENGRNAQTLVALAIALLEQRGGDMSDRSAGLFENALALDPNNANALFYAGGAAARRGDTQLAAERWEILMGLNAPPEIQALLQKKINEWRGLPPPTAESREANYALAISLSEDAHAELPKDAAVFVIARDPAAPKPPIAVKQHRLAELPATVRIGDGDAMIANRLLSNLKSVEFVVRVSLSGEPLPQPGDWFGTLLHDATAGSDVVLVIDEKIPSN